MPKIDLITGFLGSGKTTFLRKYAEYLLQKGQYIGILENDYGAVNVDMMMLADLEGDKCELEMVAGGCDLDCHRRRFKTKLITMGMYGYDRVLVEPSGVFDVDEFFDVLHEDPLDGWYQIGNVITIVNASLESVLSEQSEYLLAAQAAKSGKIVLSRCNGATKEQQKETIAHLNRALEKVGCKRDISDIIVFAELPEISDELLEELSECGYANSDHIKLPVMDENAFSSVYYMNRSFTKEEILELTAKTFQNQEYDGVFRIKGFIKEGEEWLEVNATRTETTISQLPEGQDVLIIIGENLSSEQLSKVWGKDALG